MNSRTEHILSLVLLLIMCHIFIYSDSALSYDDNMVYNRDNEIFCKLYGDIIEESLEPSCERTIKDDEVDFVKPIWKDVNIRDHKKLLKRVDKFIYYGDQNIQKKMYDDEEEFEHLFEIRFKLDSWSFSRIDIDNDGKEDVVLLLKNGKCGLSHVYSTTLLVINEGLDSVDTSRTILLLQNKPRQLPIIRRWNAGVDYNTHGVFYYKGTTYFDIGEIDGKVNVYHIKNNTVHRDCVFIGGT